MQSKTLDQLTPAAAQAILENLPERIKTAFINRAAEINYPVEAVVEMALAGYLDSEAIGFVDFDILPSPKGTGILVHGSQRITCSL